MDFYLFFWHALAWTLTIAGFPILTFPWGVLAYKVWHGNKEIDEELAEELWMRSLYAAGAMFLAAVLFLGLDFATIDLLELKTTAGPVHIVYCLTFVALTAWLMMFFYSLEDFFQGMIFALVYLYIPVALLLLVWWLVRWNPLLTYVYTWLVEPKPIVPLP